jgi:hypothetical protein
MHPEALAMLAEYGKSGKLAETTMLLENKDTEITELKSQVADLTAKLAEVKPACIDDVPLEERAAYFTAFLRELSPEDKAKLAEDTDFYVERLAAAPLAEVAPEEPAEVVPSPDTLAKPRMVITFGGRTIGTVK